MGTLAEILLATWFKRNDLKQLVNEYEEKKEKFLDDITVLDFQKAVISKTKPSMPKGMGNDRSYYQNSQAFGYREDS